MFAHGCLLYRLIHSAIAQDAEHHPDAIVVRYEDLADGRWRTFAICTSSSA